MMVFPDFVFLSPGTFSRLFNDGRITFVGRNLPLFEGRIACVSDHEPDGINTTCAEATAAAFINANFKHVKASSVASP